MPILKMSKTLKNIRLPRRRVRSRVRYRPVHRQAGYFADIVRQSHSRSLALTDQETGGKDQGAT